MAKPLDKPFLRKVGGAWQCKELGGKAVNIRSYSAADAYRQYCYIMMHRQPMYSPLRDYWFKQGEKARSFIQAGRATL